HAEFLHQLPDEYLADLLPVARKVAIGTKADHYNILQIPKPNKEEGLGIVWPAKTANLDKLTPIAQKMIQNIEESQKEHAEKI
ncbi:32722_t:CDS:2, partial [Racocetra persica]